MCVPHASFQGSIFRSLYFYYTPGVSVMALHPALLCYVKMNKDASMLAHYEHGWKKVMVCTFEKFPLHR